MKEVLITSIAFSPNMGGIETHFDDLTKALHKRGWKVWVLTYKPITTKVKARIFERSNKLIVIRIPWIGGLFYRFVKSPILEFAYLLPGLFIGLPLFLTIRGKNIKTIHSHGLVAGFVSVFWGKIFGKKVITTTHSIYHFPKKGLYRNFAIWIFGNSDYVLTLSKQSALEIEKLGIDKKKIKVFTYWIDLIKFRVNNILKIKSEKRKVNNTFEVRGEKTKVNNTFEVRGEKTKVKKRIGWEKRKFVVLSAGRLMEEKGINELLEAVVDWNDDITLAIAGTGPLESKIRKLATENRNLIYLGRVDNDDLPDYYNAADLVIVPSVHEEGFGRVILESLACGTPVIGSNRGAIPEAMDETVGKLIEVTPKKIKKAVEYYYKNPDELKKLSLNARKFAERRYSEKNVDVIVSSYKV